MNTKILRAHFAEAKEILDVFISDSQKMEALAKAGNLLAETLRSGKKIISCGNGGSMCDAMHFAEELSGRFRENRAPLPALAISDPSYITCVGNDYGFDEIFSRFIAANGTKGDVLFAISTSGNSANIIKAATVAKEKEMAVIGLTGKEGGTLASLCNIEIRAPKSAYADRAQEIHIKVIHALIDFVEQKMRNTNY